MESLFDGNFFETTNILMILTLSALEIILGFDNLVILAILIDPLPDKLKKTARRFAVSLALVTRLLLLFSIAWVISLTKPIFVLPILEGLHAEISAKDIFFLVGGLFLLYKAYGGIREMIGKADGDSIKARGVSFWGIIIQAAIIDIIFSLDSVVTAVGMTEHIGQIVVAMCLTVIVMLFFVGIISNLIEKFPSLKVLALSFIALVGVMLLFTAFGYEIPKSYVYAVMAFATFVEGLNIYIGGRNHR